MEWSFNDWGHFNVGCLLQDWQSIWDPGMAVLMEVDYPKSCVQSNMIWGQTLTIRATVNHL